MVNLTDMAMVSALLLASLRVAGLCVFAPALSHPSIPWALRLLISVAIGLTAVAQGHAPAAAMSAGVLLAAAVTEFATGLAIGWVAAALLSGVEVAGAYIAQQAGLALGAVTGMESDEADPVRRLYALLAIVIFLGIGGHRDVLAAMLYSFGPMPAGVWAGGLVEVVGGVMAASFILVLKISSPAIAALLLAGVCMGLLQRTMSGFHLLSSDLPLRNLLGMAMLAMAAAMTGRLVESAWGPVAAAMGRWLAAGGG